MGHTSLVPADEVYKMEISPTSLRERVFALSRSISAIQVMPNEHGDRTRLGLITQLPAGVEIEIRGPGFSDRTVFVRCGGASYFIFVEDFAEMRETMLAAHA